MQVKACLDALNSSFRASLPSVQDPCCEQTAKASLRSTILSSSNIPQVEAIRCLFDVWQMARLYVRHAAHPNFLHVRFEDFKTGFRQKVAEILTFAHIQPSRGGMAAHLDKVSRACNVQSWDQNKLHATDHVTFHKSSGKERLQQAVMQDAFLRQQVCRLQALLDYPLHEACAGTES